MNRYHKNHKDPEIQQKYQEWEKANAGYQARARGFKTAEAMKKADEAPKEKSIVDMLKAIGSAVMAGVQASKTRVSKSARSKKQNIRKSGGTRGS